MNISKSLKIQKAKNFAKSLHQNHTRLSGENVYEHTLRVSNKLREIGVNDENILIAAILHQSLAFSNEVKPEIKAQFGEDILKLVENYTQLSNITISHNGKLGLNEKYIIQTYLNLAKDLGVLLIRLVDKVDNLQTAFALPKKHQKIVAEKALFVYAPISRLLGLMEITRELEDGAFKILYPKQYFLIEQALESKKPQIESFFAKNIPAIRDLLRENGISSTINYRVKHVYGIYKKAIQISQKTPGNKIGHDYYGIYDMAAMRVIVENEKDCYEAEAVLSNLWDPIIDTRDDYIKNPKPSGYKSIHNHYKVEENLQIEIQIRTKEMHELNEYGPASHIFYKIGNNLKKALEKDPDWLKNLNHWQKEKELKESDAKIDTFNKNIYTFTPEGDIIELPKGATPVDFAYAVHSSVGQRCIGAIVNGEIAKLSHILIDGDQIEIRTLSAKKKPSADWLEFVKSAKAKSEIKKSLKINDN